MLAFNGIVGTFLDRMIHVLVSNLAIKPVLVSKDVIITHSAAPPGNISIPVLRL